MIKKTILFCTLVFFPLALIWNHDLFAQEGSEQTQPVIQNQAAKEKSLEAILESLSNVEKQLQAYKDEATLSSHQEKKLNELLARKVYLERNFREIASGIDISLFRANELAGETFEWSKELQLLLQPLINEVKRATSQPREIDRFRTTLTEIQQQVRLANDAIKNTIRIRRKVNNPSLSLELGEETKYWRSELKRLETQNSIVSQKLQQRLDERRSVFETVSSLPEIFFKSRGQNLLFAILATILFWILLNWIQKGLAEKARKVKEKERSFRSRAIYVGYLLLRTFGSIVVFLLSLFLLGDWVLLIIASLILLGVLWTSKQLLPRFWTQATVLLNMGPIREGERVEYLGLPWKITTVHFFSYLTNPALDSGTIRLPIKDLEDLRSRPLDNREPWFPSENGDWVILDDDCYGRITWQGIDQVKVLQLGGATKSYTTSAYLDLNPKNLSHGYRISISFGLDYADQENITEDIPNKMRAFINDGLVEKELAEQYSLNVEFEEAASSSLNVAIITDFKEGLGSRYRSLTRLLQKLCVDACNHHKWNIPFNQLTVHMDNPNS